MTDKNKNNSFRNLPVCAADYIRFIIKKMRWRKKVCADVQAELIAHFEDALKDCKADGEKEKTAKELISNFGDAKILAVLARRAKKRCRPLWQKTVIKAFQTFGIIIGLFILYVIWFISGRPKITTDYVAELNRIVKPPVADDSQNAAVYYNEAIKKIATLPDDINDVLKKSYHECNETEIKPASDWLAKNGETLNLIFIGNEKPYCWQKYESQNYGIMSVLLPHLSAYRNLARILCWKACFLAEQGNWQQSFDNIIAAYKLGKHIKAEPILIEQLVGIAIEAVSVQNLRQILGRYHISNPELLKLQNNMQAIINNEGFKINFNAEKFCIYDEMQRCFTDDFLGSGHIYPQRFFDIMYEPQDKKDFIKELMIISEAIYSNSSRNDTRRKTEQLFSFFEKISDMSPTTQRQQNINVDEEFKKIAGNNLFLEVMTPAIGKVITIGFQNKIDVEATKTIIALAIYKKEYGQYPESLQQLIDVGFIDKSPIDPYSDKPLVYKKIQDDFTFIQLWS